MPNVIDPYSILGLAPGTPTVQVKAQFRRLAKSVHPDRNGSDAACQDRLRRINAAYEFLSDPARKADYDAYLLAQRTLPVASERLEAAARPAAAFTNGPSRAVPLLVLWAVLACLIVAVVCAASQQAPGFSDPVPTVAVVEPTGPVFASPSAGQSGETAPASAGPSLWPTASAPPSGPVAAPAPGPPPAAPWSSGDTGSFPSQ